MKTLLSAALCLLLFALFAACSIGSGDSDAARSGARHHAAPAHESQRLFPSLEFGLLSAVSVSTPERSFHFRCADAQNVSVNGHLADANIFSTLLSQIEQLPVERIDAAPTGQPLLTLVVSTRDGKEHTARFYAGASDTQVHILSGTSAAPAYLSTDAWRVGTLMMTCEGTRIQDEKGNETPVYTPD